MVWWTVPTGSPGRAGRPSFPWGAVTKSQGYGQEAVATSEWSVTTKKCHKAEVMVRRPLLHLCPEDVGKHLRKPAQDLFWD